MRGSPSNVFNAARVFSTHAGSPRAGASFRARVVLALELVAVMAFAGCTASTKAPSAPSSSPAPTLTTPDVQALVQSAATAASDPMVIAVVDRLGRILAVYRTAGAPLTAAGNFGATVDADELAVSLARTAAFFSNDQAPLSSRTVRFISGVHFPPGVAFTANAPLYGIEDSNRGCVLSSNYIAGQAFPPALSINGAQPGLGITTGKAD